MKLLSIATHGIGALPDREWSFADDRGQPASLSLVVGPASAGKTTLLEAILAAKELAGAYGGLPRHLGRLRRADVEEGRLTARWLFTSGERATAQLDSPFVETVGRIGPKMMPSDVEPRVRGVFADTQPAPSCGGVAWFHAGRAMVPTQGPLLPDQPYAWLLDDNRRFEHLAPAVAQRIQEEGASALDRAASEGMLLPSVGPTRLTAMREALAPFLRYKALAGVRSAVFTQELTFVDRAGNVTVFEQLGATEKSGLLFALSLLARPVQHGLLLIDSPELHVPPDDQAGFLAAILALAPNAQVIAATDAQRLAAPGTREIRLEPRAP